MVNIFILVITKNELDLEKQSLRDIHQGILLNFGNRYFSLNLLNLSPSNYVIDFSHLYREWK